MLVYMLGVQFSYTTISNRRLVEKRIQGFQILHIGWLVGRLIIVLPDC